MGARFRDEYSFRLAVEMEPFGVLATDRQTLPLRQRHVLLPERQGLLMAGHAG